MTMWALIFLHLAISSSDDGWQIRLYTAVSQAVDADQHKHLLHIGCGQRRCTDNALWRITP